MSNEKYRLVTRSDFDGLVCAVLFKELDMIDEIKFVHPKDMQDGTILISGNDISTNLPYVEGVHLAFDHHESETMRIGEIPENYITIPSAPSAARVVFDHYGGQATFPNVTKEIMEAVDKSDSAQFSEAEILNPEGWVLLNFLMDSRTGLGRFREFRLSNYQLMMQLIDYCREHTIEEIIALPDVKERVELYMDHKDKHKEQIERCATIHDNLVVLDLRDEETIFAGNRFLIYAMFPQCNISIHVLWGLNQLNTVFATGGSIINRSNNTNIGELMLKYGGGGHKAAGTCQVENDSAEVILNDLIDEITAAG